MGLHGIHSHFVSCPNMRLILVGLAFLALANADPFVQGANPAIHPNQFVDQASEREAQVVDTYAAPVAPVIGPSSDEGASWVDVDYSQDPAAGGGYTYYPQETSYSKVPLSVYCQTTLLDYLISYITF